MKDVDRQRRQILLMNRLLSGYKEGDSVKNLINQVDALLSQVELWDDEWRAWLEAARKQWGKMEEIYSVALDREDSFDDADHTFIRNSVEGLSKLTIQAFERLEGTARQQENRSEF